MPSSETAKTKWAHKRPLLYIAAATAIFIAVITVPAGRYLHLQHATYELELVSSVDAQKKGLSGRSQLAANKGMLFVYPAESKRCFWMKDMRFPIDIIWTDAHRKITRIEAHISPQSYPKTFCAPGKYVIELNAHEAARNNLKEGQTLTF